jgi:hypothetical protein
MTLPAGSYTFAFYASDGTDVWSDPQEAGTYGGLTVSATAALPATARITAPRASTSPYAYDPG